MSSRARKKRSEMNGNSLGVVLSPGGLAAAAECSGSQSGRRSGAGFAARSRSSWQTEAADLHRGVQTTHFTRSRSRGDDARWPWRPSPPRRSVLVAVDLLAARAGRWKQRWCRRRSLAPQARKSSTLTSASAPTAYELLLSHVLFRLRLCLECDA